MTLQMNMVLTAENLESLAAILEKVAVQVRKGELLENGFSDEAKTELGDVVYMIVPQDKDAVLLKQKLIKNVVGNQIVAMFGEEDVTGGDIEVVLDDDGEHTTLE